MGDPQPQRPRLRSRPLLRLGQSGQRDQRRGRRAAKRTTSSRTIPTCSPAPGPIVKCDEEDGLKRVDTYNTFSLDYITQQGILREGYVDWGISDAVSLRGGRFILPIGFAPRDVGATTAKDMARITRLNAEANFGVMLAVSKRNADRALFDAGVMAVLGDGNREKDYDWFYFVNRTLDTNSAVTVVASARTQPVEAARSARCLQARLHRVEGRAAAELLGLEAQRRCAGGERQGVAGVVGVGRLRNTRNTSGDRPSPPVSWSAFRRSARSRSPVITWARRSMRR